MDKGDKLEWIYKGTNSLVDREEYLLGRKVDKTLEQINDEEKEKKFTLPTPKNHVEHECIPPSIRDFNKIVQAEQVDMSAKLQEDPLIAIKKREEEARRQFLQNPVQLKKLQEALKVQQKKRNKKNKKSKLDEDIVEKLNFLKGNPSYSGLLRKDKKQKNLALDTILMHKFNALKEHLTQDDLDDIMSGKIDSDSSSDEKKIARNKVIKKESEERKRRKSRSDSSDSDRYNKRHRQKERNKSIEKYKKKDHFRTERNYDSSSDDNRRNEKGTNKNKGVNQYDNNKRKQSNTKKDTTDSENSEDQLDALILKKLKSLRDDIDSDKNALPPQEKIVSKKCDDYDSDSEVQKEPKAFGLVSAKGNKIALKHDTSQNFKHKINDKDQSKTAKPETNVKGSKRAEKLSEEEKEKRRREMMMNATVRDKEREENIKKYREEDKEDEERTKKKYNKDFVHNELIKSTRVSTIEERIKSNVNNIQRSSRHMESHFSRRQ